MRDLERAKSKGQNLRGGKNEDERCLKNRFSASCCYHCVPNGILSFNFLQLRQGLCSASCLDLFVQPGLSSESGSPVIAAQHFHLLRAFLSWQKVLWPGVLAQQFRVQVLYRRTGVIQFPAPTWGSSELPIIPAPGIQCFCLPSVSKHTHTQLDFSLGHQLTNNVREISY